MRHSTSLCLLVLLASLPAASPARLAKPRGRVTLPDARSKADLVGWAAESVATPYNVTFLSWEPRIILVSNFLSFVDLCDL